MRGRRRKTQASSFDKLRMTEAGPSRQWRGVSQPKYFICGSTCVVLLHDGSSRSLMVSLSNHEGRTPLLTKSAAQLVFQNLVDHLRVGLALGRLHRLTGEPAGDLGVAAAVLLGLVGIVGD